MVLVIQFVLQVVQFVVEVVQFVLQVVQFVVQTVQWINGKSDDTCMTTDSVPPAYCDAGEELKSDGKCHPCSQGFYKDNKTPVTRFDLCTACPVKYITEGTGATSRANCTRGGPQSCLLYDDDKLPA